MFVFFTKQLLLVPLEMPPGLFEFSRIFANFRGDIRDFNRLPGVQDTGESTKKMLLKKILRPQNLSFWIVINSF